MENIIARIHGHETSQPIPNLLVTWYVTAETAVPDHIQDPNNWEEFRKANWKGFDVIRIGSASTTDDGVARLAYQREELTRRYTNLWYTIQLPEIIGTAYCGRIVHVACQLTMNASEYEEHNIRIPQNLIERYGIFRTTTPNIDAKRTAADFDIALDKVERDSVAATPTPGIEAFSSKYNREIGRAIKLGEKKFGRRFNPMSFSLVLNIESGNDASTDLPEIRYDKQRKQLRVTSSDGHTDHEVSFDGVVRYSNNNLTSKGIKRPGVLVDRDTGKVHLALPKVPTTLELSENEPSPLYTYLTRSQNALDVTDDESEIIAPV